MLKDIQPSKKLVKILTRVCKKCGMPTIDFNRINQLPKGIVLDEYVPYYEELASRNNIIEYGVADNIEQILSYHKDLLSNGEYVITIEYEYQNEQPEFDGWRWHKSGEYIGNLNPQYEYLYDEEFGEDFIGYVIKFRIVKVN